MKVLIYAHAFAPKIGGAETYVMLLAKGLSARGVSVTVATPTPRDGFDDLSLPFHVVRQPGVRALWQLIGEADIVQLAGPVFVPLAMGLLRRKPIVIEHHGYQAVCPNGLLFYEPMKAACPGHFMARRYGKCLRCNAVTVGWVKSAVMLFLTFPRRWLCMRVALNVPISHHVLLRLRLPRSQVIYYGIPDPFCCAHSSSKAAAPLDSPLTFGYIGRLVSEKGLPVLLEAARHLKEKGYAFRLQFIGDGPERRRLEELTEQYGLRDCVVFTGFLTGIDLERAVSEVAAVIMPSVWEETAGLAAIEQMMRGRLVIASDIGGLGEVVNDAGLKFLPEDVDGLLACLVQVLENPELVVELGRKARQRALSLFRQERMVDEHLEVYREILRKHHPRVWGNA